MLIIHKLPGNNSHKILPNNSFAVPFAARKMMNINIEYASVNTHPSEQEGGKKIPETAITQTLIPYLNLLSVHKITSYMYYNNGTLLLPRSFCQRTEFSWKTRYGKNS